MYLMRNSSSLSARFLSRSSFASRCSRSRASLRLDSSRAAAAMRTASGVGLGRLMLSTGSGERLRFTDVASLRRVFWKENPGMRFACGLVASGFRASEAIVGHGAEDREWWRVEGIYKKGWDGRTEAGAGRDGGDGWSWSQSTLSP